MAQIVLHDLEVLHLGVAADVIGLADAAAREHARIGAAVVADVQPVAHVRAIAVHRQRLARQRVEDHQRDQLLRELARAVVVRAVRRQRRQAVGVVPRADEMVGRGLRGRVRAVRRVRRRLAERRIVGPKRAVDLVGRDVEEAEALARLALGRARPVLARALEQPERADDVGLDERRRAVDRAVDVGLGGEVDDRARPVPRQQRRRPARGRRCRRGRTMWRGSPSMRREVARFPA